jgi:hypothetical protein
MFNGSVGDRWEHQRRANPTPLFYLSHTATPLQVVLQLQPNQRLSLAPHLTLYQVALPMVR